MTAEGQAKGGVQSPNDADSEAAESLRREQQAILKGEAEAFKDRADRFLRRTRRLSKQRAIVALKVCEQKIVNDWGNAIVNTTFGLLMGSLVVLLILIHSGVPIVGK